MRTWLVYWWDLVREKLWFLPSIYTISGLVLAVVLINVDLQFKLGSDGLLPSLETTGRSARIILGAVIGALVTVVGLVFSMTMLSVSQTASQFGPRLIRSLFDSNTTQNVVGLFLGTIAYCMVVLRSIRDIQDAGSLFTPNLSILVGELASAACLFALLSFSNHVTRCLRAETLIQSIYHDLRESANRLFPELPKSASDDPSGSLVPVSQWTSPKESALLYAVSEGYLQAIRLESLIELAAEHDHQIEVRKRPGDFVQEGAELAAVGGDKTDWQDDSRLKSRYQNCFLCGSVRTPRQDIEAGLLELVEAGVRAMSPGVNDPMTAINVIDYLSAFFRHVVRRKWPDEVLQDADGTPRIKVVPVIFPDMLATGFNQLRQNAGGSVVVLTRMLEGLEAIAEVTQDATDREAIDHHAGLVLREAQRSISEESDLEPIKSIAHRILRSTD